MKGEAFIGYPDRSFLSINFKHVLCLERIVTFHFFLHQFIIFQPEYFVPPRSFYKYFQEHRQQCLPPPSLQTPSYRPSCWPCPDNIYIFRNEIFSEKKNSAVNEKTEIIIDFYDTPPS